MAALALSSCSQGLELSTPCSPCQEAGWKSTKTGETAELAAVWMGPISAQENPKLWKQGKWEPFATLRPGTLEGRRGRQGVAAIGTPKPSSAAPHVRGEGHSTADSEMGVVQPITVETKWVSGTILSCQLKTSKAGLVQHHPAQFISHEQRAGLEAAT